MNRIHGMHMVTMMLLLVCFYGSSGHAQGSQQALYRQSHALLIGINKYQHLPQDKWLRYAENDIRALREVLVRHYGFSPERITMLLDENATQDGIRNALAKLADSRTVDREDRLLIFFSGHGMTISLRDDGEMGFLLPYDARVDLNNPHNAAPYLESCISMDTMWQFLEPSPAKHILILADACYSGHLTQTRNVKAPANTHTLSTLAAKRALQVITAGRKGEITYEKPSWGHGAFTYKLLDELNSRAAGTAAFTSHELYASLLWSVTNVTNGRQTPQMGNRGTEGEFLFMPNGAPINLNQPILDVPGTGRSLENLCESATDIETQTTEDVSFSAHSGVATVVATASHASKTRAVERATKEGARLGTEYLVSRFLTPEAQKVNSELLDTRLYTRAPSYVDSSTVCKEAKRASGGFWEVTVEVQLKAATIESALRPLWAHMTLPGSPIIRIELDGGKLSTSEIAAVRSTLATHFVKQGYTVIDSGDHLALKQDVDVCIAGTLTAPVVDKVPGEQAIYACTVTLEARVANERTGAVLSATAGKATRASFSEKMAIQHAITGAGKDWIAQNAPTIAQTFAGAVRAIRVQVTGCSLADIRKIAACLRQADRVDVAELRNYTSDTALIDVRFWGTPEELAGLLISDRAADDGPVSLQVHALSRDAVWLFARPNHP